jgi:ATP-dependent Clp protease ATP-binding subunit ClpC
VFERFTEEAGQVVTVALEEAALMRHDHVGTEHLLVALTEPLAPLLGPFGLTRERARGEVVRAVGLGDRSGSGEIPFTPAARDAIDATLEEAMQLGSEHVEPAHLLLGILRQRDGVARRMLLAAGATPREFRATVIRSLSHGDADAQALLTILERGGPLATWLRERGVNEDSVRAFTRGPG